MAEPIRQITTTAKAPSSSGITPYDLLLTGTDSSDIFSELTFGEGSAAPTQGMQAEILLDAISSGDVDPKTLSPELKALVKDRLIAQGVSEADVNAILGDSASTRNVGDPLSYDMENALALGAAKEAGLDAGGPFGADLGSVLQQLQTGPVQPTPQEKLGSTVGTQTATFGTNEQLEQEKQTLIDMIKEAGGNVGPAITEGIADFGNLVFQAITLGIDPEPLYAVIPNIMDLIKGGIGGKLVLGPSGSQQSTVIGTGQTGLGRGTKVAVGNILGSIYNIFKQGGNLGTVITQFPSVLINNLPDLINAAAAAGYAFTDDDKQTVVKAGLEPSILDAIDDDKTTTGDETGTGGDGVNVDPPKEPEAIKFTPIEQQYETVKTAPTLNATLGEQQNQIRTPAELLATLGYESTETVKTPAELAAMLGYETADVTKTPGELAAMLGYETAETTRTPAELAAMLGYETAETTRTPADLATMLGYETAETTRTPAELATMLGFDTATTVRSPGELTGMLGFDTATTVRSPGSLFGGVGYETAETTRTPAELASMLSYETGQTIRTPAEIAAILGAENTQTIRSSGAPTLTTTLGGGSSPSGGGFTLPASSGTRKVAGGPGPLVDIDYLYDFYGDLSQPFQATEDEEDVVKAAEGGMINNTDDFKRILRLLRGA